MLTRSPPNHFPLSNLYPKSSKYFAERSKTAGAGTAHSRASAIRTMTLNPVQM
jgi:hypothetical protein